VRVSYHVAVELFGATEQQLLFASRTRVDESEFEQRREDEQHARRVPDVDRLQIGHPHRVAARSGQLGGHGEHGGDAESDASRLGVLVDPEADPRQHHDQHRRDVCLQDEEADLALQKERRLEARVVA